EVPSSSKKQKSAQAANSNAADEGTPVLSAIPEQANIATTQDPLHNDEPTKEKKKKKKKKDQQS
ncbi:hypothetical protein L195_g063044, partial [Trifolium pratense]